MTDRWTKQEKLLLAVICGVVFLDTLDLSLVQVALPSIGSALRLGEGPLQWIVSGFVLGYGGFLLLGGRCADVLGRRGSRSPGPSPLAGDPALGRGRAAAVLGRGGSCSRASSPWQWHLRWEPSRAT